MKHAILFYFALLFCDNAAKMSDEVGYDYVKSLKNNATVYLIDVREPKELQETGEIPGSINIPLANLEDILKNSPDSYYLEKFQREKPKLDSPLVFTCRSGRRSLMALNIAKNLGFTNVKHYPGGWLGWAEESKNAS